MTNGVKPVEVECEDCSGEGFVESGYFAEPHCEFIPTGEYECETCEGSGTTYTK